MRDPLKIAGCNPRCGCVEAIRKELERREKLERKLVSKLCKECRWCYGDDRTRCDECWVKKVKKERGWRA